MVFLINLLSGLSMIAGVVLHRHAQFPHDDWAHVASDVSLSLMLAGVPFYLAKAFVIIWENDFGRNFFSKISERILICLFPIYALSGGSMNAGDILNQILLCVGAGLFFFDVGNFWRNLFLAKVWDGEIERFISAFYLPINPNSKFGVGFLFVAIYGGFIYSGWKMM
ncbi:hypothetical protein ACO0K9_02095 [Undibacterium sp. Ji50W]|uniref:hypothetical protein n=1 Tax=Undibacterium sp. Ji50W TaxID=3413041 RepID=UPI003BF4592A